jgi:hypothetical protein
VKSILIVTLCAVIVTMLLVQTIDTNVMISPVSPLPTKPPICPQCGGGTLCEQGKSTWILDCYRKEKDAPITCCLICADDPCRWYTPTPKVQPTEQAKLTAQPAIVWYALDLWQGRYILLQNQHGEYCLPELSPCP